MGMNQHSTSAPEVSPLTRALVVDDSISQRLLLSHMLGGLGYDVTTAKNGEDAVGQFNGSHPDIIFMDIEMPVMSGIEAVREIRKILGEIFIPIIFVTGGSSDKYLEECIDAGGDEFIRKPFNAAFLSAKTKSLLRIKELYDHQITQKRQIEAFKDAENQEHESASILYDKIVKSGYMESPLVRSELSPMAMFNGDILLCAYTPSNNLNLLLGDFTGHGLISAVAAAPTAEIFYGMTSKGFGIQEIVEEINYKLNILLPPHMFLAATIACLDRETHHLSTITCGLPDHILFNKKNGHVNIIKSDNLPLGIVPSNQLNFIDNHIKVTSSHRLFLFTDGLIESEDEEGIPFEVDGIRNSLSLKEGVDSFDLIMESLAKHRGNKDQQDDITLVRLTCDFDRRNWKAHSNGKAEAPMAASTWKVSSTMDFNILKLLNPVPTMVNSIMDVQGLITFRESIFLIVTELFVNSLDHGLLGLDSSMKKDPDGFAAFFELKKERLDDLSSGEIKLIFSHQPHGKGGKLTIRIQDTGDGFDESNVVTDIQDSKQYSGRGISLVRSLCESLEYSDGGRRATAVFIWARDT